MGIKYLKVIGDSNLVACQAKGSFSLKEPSLARYRTMAQKMKERFSTFEIGHAQRSENRCIDALGSQIAFKGSNTRVEVSKQNLLLKYCRKGSKKNKGVKRTREFLLFNDTRYIPKLKHVEKDK